MYKITNAIPLIPSIAKKDCINIKDVTERLIDVAWNEDKTGDVKHYISKLTILTNGLKSNLLEIITKATQRNVVVSSINVIAFIGATPSETNPSISIPSTSISEYALVIGFGLSFK